MARILSNFKQRFYLGNSVVRLIFINASVFALIVGIRLINQLFFKGGSIIHWIELPDQIQTLLLQPWSIISYMFVHTNFWHLLFNLLWLYFFGMFFLERNTNKQLTGVYLLSGVVGGLFFLIGGFVFPKTSALATGQYLIGASAAVIGIVIATAMQIPNRQVRLFLFGNVPLKYIAIGMIVFEILSFSTANFGGNIAHVGGGLLGALYAWRLRKGKDITAIINTPMNWLANEIKYKKKRSFKVHRGKGTHSNNQTTKPSPSIEPIIQKLKQSGYGSLNEEEKKALFQHNNPKD